MKLELRKGRLSLRKKMRRTADTIVRFGLIFLALIVGGGLLSLAIPANARARAQAKLPHPLKQDEGCLACHGQVGMTSGNGKSISLDPAKHADVIVAFKGDPVWMAAREHRAELTEVMTIIVPEQAKCAIYRVSRAGASTPQLPAQ